MPARQPPLPKGEREKRQRKTYPVYGVLAALTFVCSLALPAAADLYVRSLGPLDLLSARSGSAVVVDRDGRLLRPFTMANGRWRLPVSHTQVDPRYLAMLVAYEDARFNT